MAAPADLELADNSKKKGKSKLILIIVGAVLGLVAVAGTVVGTMYMMGGLNGGDKGGGHTAEKKSAEPPKPAIYVTFPQPFVVNFDGQGMAKFLQVGVELMGRDPEKMKHVEENLPALRNALVLLFSSQTYSSVNTTEGKEAMRKQALQQVNAIMKRETGEDKLVEDVFFTSIVMQ